MDPILGISLGQLDIKGLSQNFNSPSLLTTTQLFWMIHYCKLTVLNTLFFQTWLSGRQWGARQPTRLIMHTRLRFFQNLDPHNLEEFVMILHFKVNPQSHLKYMLVGFHVSSTFGIEHFFNTINHYLSWLYIYIYIHIYIYTYGGFLKSGISHVIIQPGPPLDRLVPRSLDQPARTRRASRIAGDPETALSNGDELMNQGTKWWMDWLQMFQGYGWNRGCYMLPQFGAEKKPFAATWTFARSWCPAFLILIPHEDKVDV